MNESTNIIYILMKAQHIDMQVYRKQIDGIKHSRSINIKNWILGYTKKNITEFWDTKQKKVNSGMKEPRDSMDWKQLSDNFQTSNCLYPCM